jgi:hypothetical protein
MGWADERKISASARAHAMIRAWDKGMGAHMEAPDRNGAMGSSTMACMQSERWPGCSGAVGTGEKSWTGSDGESRCVVGVRAVRWC